jgi:hypothetical protein
MGLALAARLLLEADGDFDRDLRPAAWAIIEVERPPLR